MWVDWRQVFGDKGIFFWWENKFLKIGEKHIIVGIEKNEEKKFSHAEIFELKIYRKIGNCKKKIEIWKKKF